MKHVNLLALAFLLIFFACSKDEDTTTKPCTVTTLTATLPGKWKLANTGSIMVYRRQIWISLLSLIYLSPISRLSPDELYGIELVDS